MVSASSKELLKKLPSPEEMQKRLLTLHSQPDQVIAITGASYLENALEILLTARFVNLNSDETHRIFDGGQNGILATANAKIRITYALGLASQETYRDLLLINAIRNVFAHTLHHCDFGNPLIVRDCRKLKSYKPVEAVMAELTAKHQFVNNILTIYLEILRRVAPLAIAKAVRGAPDVQPPSLDKSVPPSQRKARPNPDSKKP